MNFVQKNLKICFFTVLFLQSLIWIYAYNLQARWINVPPPPSRNTALLSSFGDAQLYYRYTGLILQNLGDYGGRVVPFQDYNYDDLVEWFFLSHDLDANSNFVPYLAAYYFSAVQDKEKLRPLIQYLRYIGQSNAPLKWRWTAQAAFLARFDLKDQDLALEIANELANRRDVDLPIWARQMPAIILSDLGNKDAAEGMIIETLRTEGDRLHPTEVNFLRALLCERILNAEEASENPVCNPEN